MYQEERISIMLGNSQWNQRLVGMISPTQLPKYRAEFRSEDLATEVPSGWSWVEGDHLTNVPANVQGEQNVDYWIFKIGQSGGKYYIKTPSEFVDDDGDDTAKNMTWRYDEKSIRDGASLNDVVRYFTPLFGYNSARPTSKPIYFETLDSYDFVCLDSTADNYSEDGMGDYISTASCTYSCSDAKRLTDGLGRCTNECVKGYVMDANEGRCVKASFGDSVGQEIQSLPLKEIGLVVGGIVALQVALKLGGRKK